MMDSAEEATMEKVRLDRNTSIYPMPMSLVGAIVDGRPNFQAVAWVSRVNYDPPMMAVSLGASHTSKGVREHKEFSVNIPGVDLAKETDYCGIVSGRQHDKARLFEIFSGELAHAPMIRACPLTMECRLVQSVALQGDTLYIGEIVAAYAEAQCLTDGKPDVHKMKPFVLTMPDNNYWAIGELVGKAWGIGKVLVGK
jgi:flavin reductase (DIM6/NTAB) family NADH-FMN oxidoreductase RutF